MGKPRLVGSGGCHVETRLARALNAGKGSKVKFSVKDDKLVMK